ncbi:unconventional myosin-VIIa-like isoform X2 [Syngnathoides biaculeatus]|uniref:unconventional myosin-VIIa-like isoform X2 n=1 Tax=Syngnathoides biaculeatus TaxID=300417 RepID=UPI002ADDDA80|nr:unconventional myosin-VIIa-like isoform X2 [Syngnathoides biaculeatus]
MLRKGEWVWLDSDTAVPIGARVKETASGRRSLVDDAGKEHKLSPETEASLKIMHPTSVEGVDDMIKLGDMTEAGLLRNLLLRHKQGIIYTYTGSVLVAVNPYQVFPIYSDEQVRLYRGRKLGELPPHIFAIAESCHFNMKRHLRNQCCIISGESGAGKTESTKLILQYLAAVSGELSKQRIEDQILESNPILEAFGNAKTVKNDNSSRFGKYLEIFFNEGGVIEGARVEQYLLEKSRVCRQAQEERNYHIFYCMLAGITAEEKKSLHLKRATDYVFLTKGDCIRCEGRDDAEDFSRIRSAMKILTFSDQQSYEILQLLAAILHLGNLHFEAHTQNNLESSDVSKSEHFGIAASLLKVQNSVLANSLTHRTFMTNRERVTKPLDCEQASASRDAFVKAIYNKLFVWIVGKINGVIHKRIADDPKSSFLSIGLLDIFGFENFQTNSFEQLCINFANEKLQQFFVGHIFKLEQKEYLKESIVWNNIKFGDNQKILDLLAGKPCNLLALIDEESLFPKGSDLTMLGKMNRQHRGDEAYVPSKGERDTDFGIRHFAGVVYYDSRGFLEKNRDAVSADIFKMVDLSSNKLLQQIFTAELSFNGVKTTNSKRVLITPGNSMRLATEARKHVPTLSGQFRQSLDSLMKALSVCQPYFIRCFKPNSSKQSEDFDRELCTRQLRYSGMMDTIRIRKLGYPVRHSFAEFLTRYRVLLKTTVCDPKTNTAAACCDAICRTALAAPDQWKIGKTKIFLKDAHDAILERLREEELGRKALVIQRFMLGYKHRQSFLKKRRAAAVLQKNWRAYRDKRARKEMLRGFERLVSTIRGRKLQYQFRRERAAALTLQAHVRGHQARKRWKRKREAAALLQASTGGLLARRSSPEREIALPEPHAPDQRESEEDLALELQRRLEDVVIQAQRADEEPEPEPEPIAELDSDSVEGKSDVPPVPLVTVTVCEELESEEMEKTESRSGLSASASGTTTPTPSLLEEEDEDEDDFEDFAEEFSFYRFSLLHFQGDASNTHIYQRLKKPLLQHDDEGDSLACLTVWWIILRFMGDLPEPRAQDATSQVSLSISRQLPQRQGRRLSNLVGLDQKILRKNRKKHGNRKASSAILEEPENLTEDEDVLIGEGPTLDRPLSPLEKLHIIVGYALSKRGIRDEIYCQICKQLTKNPSRASRLQGWALLAVCLGIFPPTDLLVEFLQDFVRRGPDGYAEYCSRRLDRIRANGERKELPCWLELQAAKAKDPIEVTATLADGKTVSLQLDSASTSAEVCRAAAEQILLRDAYGFSLYIRLFDKMWSLGSCGKHVLDAVSQCEQEMRRQGKPEKDTPVEFSIRKELFTPWHDCSEDPVSTDLIYKQLVQGVKSGEYASEKEDDYVLMATKHYYVQFGSTFSKENVQRVVEDCIAIPLIENKSMAKWVQLISSAYLQGAYTKGTVSRESVKGELVDGGRVNWPAHFSKFYEVTMISGPTLPKSKFVMAVNWSGIFFMDGRDKKLLELPYLEVQQVSKLSEQTVSVGTVRGQFVLVCGEADDVVALVDRNLSGLRARSVFALAQHDSSKTDDSRFLVCKQGDLLLVENDPGFSSDKNLVKATNQKTNVRGAIRKDALTFLPTLSRPADDVLELLSPGHGKSSVTQSGPQREETVAPVSLREFALDNFRPLGKERLWVNSKELLKQPLMKDLVRNSDLNYLACNAFTAILKYMGDYPIKQIRSPIELTDQIFGPATQHRLLQDEIYCQIMRQMTNNGNRSSMERGWQLMWLCSGLFPPSQNLMKHAQRFLESRPREPLAAGCLQRLQQMRSKEPRKHPPPLLEVDAIQQNSTHIFHKIHFPNDTNDIFEVTSTTTIQDLCSNIASQLQLSSPDGYGLYLKTSNKMLSLTEQNYIFDSLREATDISKKGKKVREGNGGRPAYGAPTVFVLCLRASLSLPQRTFVSPVNLAYALIFKRKLWFNVIPGKDSVADLTFHFPQELPKYLLGYHKCSKEDMIKVGGLLFRAKVDSDRSQFIMIPKMLRHLVPADHIKSASPEEWKKHIMSSYNKQSGITVDECKVAFLRAISGWPTFGCTFFEVKQTCESSYPSPVLIAISKQGVSLIDPKSKELLVMHPFSRITECHSRDGHFQMTVGTLLRGNVFACETSQGHTMEDLLRSYVRMYERQREAFRSGNHMFA